MLSPSPALMKSVAPNLRASASLAGCMSIAMIRPAPARRAPEMTLSPTPPTPITATVSPGFTAAVLIAAPAPVTHPQPRIQACGKGNFSGMLASWFSGNSEYSGKGAVQKTGVTGAPARARRGRSPAPRHGKTGAGNDIEPYPAHADHRDRIARLYGGGVDRGASSGYASAAQDRSLREGQFFRYFGKLVLVHQRIFGEGRCAEDGCDGLAIARQSRRVIGAAQRLLGMLALIGAPLETGSAMPAILDQRADRSEEHTSELQSLMRISYAVFCLKKNKKTQKH